MTSSSRRKLRTTAWSAAAGIEWQALPALAIGIAVFAAAVSPGMVSAAWSDASKSSASAPPAGVILEGAAESFSADAPEAEADDASGEKAISPAPEPNPLPAPEPDESVVLVTLADTATLAARKPETQKEKDAAKNACGEQSKDCKEALKNLRDDGIESIALDIRVGGRPGSDYPCECRLEGEAFTPRRFATTTMTWKAAGYCHKPLYFEDWNLERYGHSHGALDPVFSAAHFFVSLPVLPYKMGVELPWECVYPLGYYRPGNCAPWTVPAAPISCRGFAVEAATVTGLLFLLP